VSWSAIGAERRRLGSEKVRENEREGK